jgi:hypothetical protein
MQPSLCGSQVDIGREALLPTKDKYQVAANNKHIFRDMEKASPESIIESSDGNHYLISRWVTRTPTPSALATWPT